MGKAESDILEECQRLDKRGLLREAVELLSAAISSVPAARLFYERGQRYEALRELTAALDDYTCAIIAEPSNSRYLMARGQLLYNYLQRAGDAVEDLRTAASIDPDSPTPHQHLTFCYLLLGDADSATRHATLAVELNAKIAISHYCLAKCYLALNRIYDAIVELETATELAPNDWLYWNALGKIYKHVGWTPDALECYEHANRASPSATSFIALARLQLELGSPNDAISSLNSATNFTIDDGQRLLVEGYMRRAVAAAEAQGQGDVQGETPTPP